MKKNFLSILLVLSFSTLFAQQDTCDCKKNKPLTLPLVLVGIGSINALDRTLDVAVKDFRQSQIPNFRTHVDDYLPYTPLMAAYALNLAGNRGVHNLGGLSLYSASSILVSTAITQGLKHGVDRERPDGKSRNSFPSGHSASAFCFATVLHKEYGKKSVWYSVAAYGAATATASLRVMNNRHWFSDVCAGAGIGILSTEISYRLLDKYFSKKRKQTFRPFY
jgi:membrane-associated phospholipid phosphatase